MNETSTQPQTQMLETNEPKRGGVSQRTIEFLRQFARAYMPVAEMPGLVLN